MKNQFYLSIIFMCILFNNFAVHGQCINSSLRSVKTTSSSLYNYIIFTFKGTFAPVFTITNTSPPFKSSPSDNALTVNGCNFKSIKFKGASYCSVNLLTSSLPLQVVKDVKNAEQFESIYNYIIGLRCASSNLIQYTYAAGANTVRVLRFRK